MKRVITLIACAFGMLMTGSVYADCDMPYHKYMPSDLNYCACGEVFMTCARPIDHRHETCIYHARSNENREVCEVRYPYRLAACQERAWTCERKMRKETDRERKSRERYRERESRKK